ncbi:MAG: dTMP kinase [Alphaproteobacteria bacterium]
MRGKFITLEGGEGAGKSTQAKRLAARLQERGHRVVLTREPGGSQGAEEIRRLLVEGSPERWTPLAEALLFTAARVDHVAKLILAELQDGAWVVCDRFSDSTLAYQGIARGLGVEPVRALQSVALEGFKPDLTIMLDMPVESGLQRAHVRGPGHGTRYERFGPDFHRKLRQAFLDIAKDAPERCVVINGDRKVDVVAEQIWQIVEERLAP